jgi:hypothetical protein
MRAHVLKQYPGLGMEFTLNDRIATYFPAKPAPGARQVRMRAGALLDNEKFMRRLRGML